MRFQLWMGIQWLEGGVVAVLGTSLLRSLLQAGLDLDRLVDRLAEVLGEE